MSNITPDEALLRPYAATSPVAAMPAAHLTARPARAVQQAAGTKPSDRVSVSPQARNLRAMAEARPARAQKAQNHGAHVSLERLARIKQAYEARRIRPNPQIIATHLLEERRWL